MVELLIRDLTNCQKEFSLYIFFPVSFVFFILFSILHCLLKGEKLFIITLEIYLHHIQTQIKNIHIKSSPQQFP